MTSKLNKDQLFLGYFFAICATIIWSGNFIVARELNDSVQPISLAFWRWVVAVIALLPFAIKPFLTEWNVLKKHLPYLSVTALLGVALFNTLIYFAAHTTTALNMSLIAITFPVFIIVFSRIFFRELITVNKWAGILLVVAGVVTLVTKGVFVKLLNLSFAIGDLWMLIAAIVFAIYSILLKHKPKNLSIWSLQLSTFMLGLIFLFPFYLWEFSGSLPIVIETGTVFSILYLGLFAALAAFVLWNKAVIEVGPTKAGMIYYMLPIFSGILAYFVLGEAITMMHIFSAILIISGILIANYERKSKRVFSSSSN